MPSSALPNSPMWNAFKSLLTRFRNRDESDPVFDEVRALVEELLAQDFGDPSERKTKDEQVIAVLKRLDKEIESIKEQASGYYPDGTISAQVWLRGAGYANLCRELTLHFRKAGWLAREENTSALWARATLAVCAHYHHMVGPAMLANADCQERLGNAERAAQMYRAIVGDFEFLLDEDHADDPLDEDERTAIESLRTALRRLLEIGTGLKDKERLEQLLASAEAVLK